MTCRHKLPEVPARPPRRFRLRVPILLVWLLLLPFVLLLAPIVFLVCLLGRVSPFRGVAVFWQLFSGLRGVRVQVDDPVESVSIRIS